MEGPRGVTMAMAAGLRTWRRMSGMAAGTRHLHEGPDTVEELLERHLVKTSRKKSAEAEDDDPVAARRRLTSTRREALSLYRDILRATRFFTWMDERGAMWRDRLRENARREFEEARFETDPEVVTRLLIGGRDAVQAAVEKLVEKSKRMVEEEKNKTCQDRDKNW